MRHARSASFRNRSATFSQKYAIILQSLRKISATFMRKWFPLHIHGFPNNSVLLASTIAMQRSNSTIIPLYVFCIPSHSTIVSLSYFCQPFHTSIVRLRTPYYPYPHSLCLTCLLTSDLWCTIVFIIL